MNIRLFIIQPNAEFYSSFEPEVKGKKPVFELILNVEERVLMRSRPNRGDRTYLPPCCDLMHFARIFKTLSNMH